MEQLANIYKGNGKGDGAGTQLPMKTGPHIVWKQEKIWSVLMDNLDGKKKNQGEGK